MRQHARVDQNQKIIIKALRAVGASVQPIHGLGGRYAGGGVPDLLVGWQGNNFLLEVKDGNKTPSQRKLTQDEIEWHQAWRGSVHVVETVADAIRAITGSPL